MAQFEEVLDRVRQALTWSSPAEVQALLQGLVEERIISEAYSKSLSLHRLTEGIAPEPACGETASKPGSGLMNPADHWHLNQSQHGQVCRESAVTDHNQTRLQPLSPMENPNSIRSRPRIHPPVMDTHYLNQRHFSTSILYNCECSLESHDEMTELLRIAESMQKPVSDSERINKGNLENEREWLEQVEEAARLIAVPLWQHWDRGQRMLLPKVPFTAASCAASVVTATGSAVQCPVLDMEEETELAIACKTLHLYADNFSSTDAAITEPESLLDIKGATEPPEGPFFSRTGLNTDCISGAARNASPVEACSATDTRNNITGRLEGDLDFCWLTDKKTDTTEDPLCLTGDIQYGCPGFTEDITHLFSSFAPKDIPTNAQDNLFDSNTDHIKTSGILDKVENVFMAASCTNLCSNTECLTDFFENKEDKWRTDSYWGKSGPNHHIMSLFCCCLHPFLSVRSGLCDLSG